MEAPLIQQDQGPNSEENEESEALQHFRAACTVPFRLDANGKIWCTCKLNVRPPDALIPDRVLRLKMLYDRAGGLHLEWFRNRRQMYSAKQWLRRFRLIPESSYGSNAANRRRRLART